MTLTIAIGRTKKPLLRQRAVLTAVLFFQNALADNLKYAAKKDLLSEALLI